jgi:hypothetical protein
LLDDIGYRSPDCKVCTAAKFRTIGPIVSVVGRISKGLDGEDFSSFDTYLWIHHAWDRQSLNKWRGKV